MLTAFVIVMIVWLAIHEFCNFGSPDFLHRLTRAAFALSITLTTVRDLPMIAIIFGLLFSLFVTDLLAGLIGPRHTKVVYMGFGVGWLISSMMIPPFEVFEFWVFAIVIVSIIILDELLPEPQHSVDPRLVSNLVAMGAGILAIGMVVFNLFTIIFLVTLMLLEAWIIIMDIKLKYYALVAMWSLILLFQILATVLLVVS